MNKFELINVVLVSDLGPEDKCLLVELLMRANDQWECWPSVERLCQVRGIKYTKNFKGADHYLPGLVTKVKKGRKNVYIINTPAVEGLSQLETVYKRTNTPAQEGSFTPAVEGVSDANTPAVADNTPAVEGANSSKNNTEEDSTEENTSGPASAVPHSPNSDLGGPSLNSEETDHPSSKTTTKNTPSVEGVSNPMLLWNRGQKEEFESLVRIYKVTPEQATDAALLLNANGFSASSWNEKCVKALNMTGVVINEW